VAAYLVNNIKANKSITITHQQIASDLGSSREVISRILGDFSQRGLVESSRGMIEINDLEELKALADM